MSAPANLLHTRSGYEDVIWRLDHDVDLRRYETFEGKRLERS